MGGCHQSFFNPLEKKLVGALWSLGKKRVSEKVAHRLVNQLWKKVGSMPFKPYPDIITDLQALRKKSWMVFLSTDNPVWIAKSIVKRMGVENLFDGFLGKPRSDEHKVVSHVRALARRFGIKPEDFFRSFAFYDDTPEEMHFARKLGILAIGRTTNFSAKKMRRAGAHRIVVGKGRVAHGRLVTHVLRHQRSPLR
ncbi:HAD hydrolase-like protein [Candidatus Micrarchaeota archaeon]|nr:HAD hydrolase-like protein [Candidatus Micrarchaeota archaeon]MBU1931022.1 HAD hydrolase-like protein [Candidatus Micrarchaeota archaeon]